MIQERTRGGSWTLSESRNDVMLFNLFSRGLAVCLSVFVAFFSVLAHILAPSSFLSLLPQTEVGRASLGLTYFRERPCGKRV